MGTYWRSHTAVVLLAGLSVGCGAEKSASPAAVDPATQVLRVHEQLNQVQFPKEQNAEKLRTTLHGINAIDISRCPPDYQKAYIDTASAFGAMVDFAEEKDSWQYSVSEGVESFLRGFTLIDPFATVREARERRRHLQARITESLAQYQRTLARYRR